MDIGQSLQNMFDTVLRVAPQVLLFLVILIVGYFVAKALQRVTDSVLERLGFDRLVERGGLRQAMSRSGYDASDIAARLVYFAVLIFTLQLAFGVFGNNPVSDLLRGIVAWLPQAFVGIVIIVVAAYLAGMVRDIIRGALGGTSYGPIVATVAYAFILGVGIIAALTQIGVAVAVTGPILWAFLFAVSGIAIVGVGGGLIRPMQERWERWLNSASREMIDLRQQQMQRATSSSASPSSGLGTPGSSRSSTMPPNL